MENDKRSVAKTDAEKLAELRSALAVFRGRVAELTAAPELSDEVWAGLSLLGAAMDTAIGLDGGVVPRVPKLSAGRLNVLRATAAMGLRQREVRPGHEVLVYPADLAALLDGQVTGVVEIVQVALAGECSCSESGCVHDQVRQVHDRAVAKIRDADEERILRGHGPRVSERCRPCTCGRCWPRPTSARTSRSAPSPRRR